MNQHPRQDFPHLRWCSEFEKTETDDERRNEWIDDKNKIGRFSSTYLLLAIRKTLDETRKVSLNVELRGTGFVDAHGDNRNQLTTSSTTF